MKDKKSSTIQRVLLALIVFTVGIMAYAGATGQLSLAGHEVFGAIKVPFEKVGAVFTNGIDGVIARFVDYDVTVEENETLKTEIAALREQLVEFERYKAENEQYKQYLNIQEQNPSFKSVSAAVIGRDPASYFSEFTIDKGSLSGIKVKDAVITVNGIVGRVVEVGPNYAKVATILDPSVNISVMVSSTRDSAIVSGDAKLSIDGRCLLTLLPRESQAKEGGIVVTTGLGGVFPPSLIVGTIESISSESSGKSLAAVIKPLEKIENTKFVFVITEFTV